MTRLPLFVLPGALLVALGAPHAFAQESAPPAHVAYVEGRAVLEHDTASEDAEPNLPLDTGDRLRTERGRVEVLFGDGSIVQLDEETTIDVLSDSLVRQLAGRVAIVAGSARAGRLQVDTPAGSVRITSAGEFRVSVFAQDGVPEIEVAVIRGSADLVTDSGTVSIGAGARALARQGEAPSQPMSFNSARWDAFDRWSQDRLSLRRGAASHQYVPPPLRPYGAVLDTYGSWNYEPTYGYVWYPHVVSGWRPYLPRPLAVLRPLRVDVGGRRRLGMADAPLRPVGHDLRWCLVLGAWSRVGSGLGALGRGARVRQLVPARVRRPAGGAIRIRARVAGVLQAGSVDSMDRRAPQSLRRVRVGQARSGGRPPLHPGWRAPVRRSDRAAATTVRGPPIRWLYPQHAPALRVSPALECGAVWGCLQAPANAPGKRQQPAIRAATSDPAASPRSGRPRFGEAPQTPRQRKPAVRHPRV